MPTGCLEEGSLGNPHHNTAQQCKALLRELLHDTRAYLTAQTPHACIAEQRLSNSKHTHEAADLLLGDINLPGASQLSFAMHPLPERGGHPPDAAAAALWRCYLSLSRLSVLAEHTTRRAGYSKGGEGGMSRASQYLRFLIAGLVSACGCCPEDLRCDVARLLLVVCAPPSCTSGHMPIPSLPPQEELRCLKDYRTPVMLRAAHGVLLHIFVVVLAPYFSHFCSSWQADGHDRST